MNRPLDSQNRVWKPLIASTRVLILGLLLVFGVAACASVPTPTPTPQPIEKAIVGKWVSPQGGEVDFYADNTGFIPGLKGEPEDIPDSKFNYYFQDKTHLGIALEGQTSVIMEIKIEGDKMTWRGQSGSKEYVYQRAK